MYPVVNKDNWLPKNILKYNKFTMFKVPKAKVIRRERRNNHDIEVHFLDHSDYNAVMSISEGIYGGTDYLPDRYHWFLDSGRAFMLIAYVDEKPVSFTSHYLIDGYETAIGMAARTLQQYEGFGYLNLLRQCSMEILLRIPTFKTISAVSRSEIQRMATIKGVILSHWNAFEFGCRIESLRNYNISSDKNVNVQEPPMETIMQIFQCKENRKIFQSKRFCFNDLRMPFKVNEENLSVAAQSSLVFITSDETRSTDEQPIISALTFASCLNVPKGMQFALFYYGSLDIEVYKRHISRAMCRLANQIQGSHIKTIECIIHFPQQYNVDEVEDYIMHSYHPIDNPVLLKLKTEESENMVKRKRISNL